MSVGRCLVCVVLLGSVAVGAEEKPLPPLDLGKVTEKHVMIPMRDGVKLSAYLYFPEGTGPWPVLYEQRYADLTGAETRKAFARLAEAGYVVCGENFRGTHLSEGTWVGYRALGWGEKKDGYDTVEWLASQPWSTGKIGTFGSSQAGFAQNFLAVTQPPHLVAQYMIDTGLSLYQEGYRIGGTTRPERFKGMDAVCRVPEHNRKLMEEWFAHPTYDAYWAEEDCTRFIDKMNVPCFTIGSWYDFMCVGSVESFIGRQHRGGENSKGKQQLLIGPWLHGRFNKGNKVSEMTYPENAAFDVEKHLIRWFDHYLKGKDNGVEKDPPVRYYVMGAIGEQGPGNIWREAADWPLKATTASLYLHPDGALKTTAPTLAADDARSRTAFKADPLHPNEIPARGFPGAADARGFEKQADVRTFTTDVLDKPVCWTGNVKAELYVTSTAPDSDFIVRVTDVYPDGRSILIVDMVRRARYREGFEREVPLEPGKPTKIAFDVGWLSQVFNKGHRIRVTVASTGAPFYEVNPNTGKPLTIEFPKETLVAENAVLHNKDFATRILAPVVDVPPATIQAIDTRRGDAMIAAYFQKETKALSDKCLNDLSTAEDWATRRPELHRQLREMLGLDPWPEKTPLEPVVTGTVDHGDFAVENVHFQSRPGLYVTGNLYRPRTVEKPLPAILYVCGHGKVKKGDVSFGNKTHYQHHGAWFARNGYVCLTIDTIQLGEIEGVHHGTYNLDQFWWNARGYTPAGVEAWNGIRAIDYLQSRPEVDGARIGVTGRSGGGAYSWWIAALDDRIRAAVPVAGITDLENHVVDGCVEGHCDCMYLLNTYRWDYAMVAAQVAPRPLLISNTDKDGIFPLEGVVRVHDKTRRVYRLLKAEKSLGIQITEGPHADTQELHIHAFRWFNRFLKDDPKSQVELTAVKFFEPEQLRVFSDLPKDEIVTKVAESFVLAAPAPAVPESKEAWEKERDSLKAVLLEKVFRGWPDESGAGPLDVEPAFSAEADGVHFEACDFTSQHDIRLRLYVAHRAGLKPSDLELVVLNALDFEGWSRFVASMLPGFAKQFEGETLPAADAEEYESQKKMFAAQKWGMAWIAPRGVGPTAWNQNPEKHIQIRRRFQLLGQTLDGMQTWDIRRAAQALRSLEGFSTVQFWMQGERRMSGLVLYASLFEPNVHRLDLWNLPSSHKNGPDFLNVLRFLDIPQTVALAAERSMVRLYQSTPEGWDHPKAVATRLGWDAKQIQVRVIPQK